jgi:hypothetical protein
MRCAAAGHVIIAAMLGAFATGILAIAWFVVNAVIDRPGRAPHAAMRSKKRTELDGEVAHVHEAAIYLKMQQTNSAVLVDAFLAAQFRDAVLAAQIRNHDADLFLRRILSPGCPPNITNPLLRLCRIRLCFRSHRRSLRVTMSSIPSLAQSPHFVQLVLTGNNEVNCRWH